MLQLNEIASDFLKMKFEYLVLDNEVDAAMLVAVNEPSMHIDIRKAAVARWLHRYAVLRIRGVTGIEMAEKILAFADTKRLPTKQLTPGQIKAEFRRLEPALRVGTPSLREGNPKRKIDSLASKALWCLYPEVVPILDKYAECSLMVLTRLCGLSAIPSSDRYEAFVDSWFLIYEQIRENLPSIDKSVYPYEVRFMDRFLWWLGTPAFENFESSAPHLEHSPPAQRIAKEMEDMKQ